MASLSTIIRITHPKNDRSGWAINLPAGHARLEATNLALLMERISSGLELATYEVCLCATVLARATGSITITGGSGSVGAVINGVTVTVAWAASDNNSAALVAAAINASSTALVKSVVTAAVDATTLNKVNITAFSPGLTGNAITIAASGTGVSASGARLTGGTGDDGTMTNYVRS